MRRYGLKRWLLFVVAILATLSVAACGASTGRTDEDTAQTEKTTPEAGETTPQIGTSVFEGKTVRKVTVYDVSGDEATYKIDGHTFVPGENTAPLWETEEPEQVARFVTAFEGWIADEHKGTALDLGGQCFICFDDQVLIEYCGRIDSVGYVYFGRIYSEDGFLGNFDLPADFCEAVEEILHA